MAPLFLRTILWLRRRSRGGRPHLLRTRRLSQSHVHNCRLSTIPGDAVGESLDPDLDLELLLQERCIWTSPADLIRCTPTYTQTMYGLQLLQTAGWIATDHKGLSSAVIDYDAHAICRLAVHRAQGYDQTGSAITLARLLLIKYWLFVPWPLDRLARPVSTLFHWDSHKLHP